ncbi:hypothetical protein ACFL3I_12460 [Pseudomonadota bacterium]
MIDRITARIRERCEELAEDLCLVSGTQLSGFRSDRKTIIENLLELLRDFYRHRSSAFHEGLINQLQQSKLVSVEESQIVGAEDTEFKVGNWYLIGTRTYRVLKTHPSFEIEDQGSIVSFSADNISKYWDHHIFKLSEIKTVLHRYKTQQFSAEDEILEITKAFQSELKEAHEFFLQERGLGDCDLRPSRGSQRHVHCYSCEEELDNSVDLEGSNCGWIVCVCGACGCGYSKSWGD